MDYHAFDKLSYGLYIVSSEAGGKAAGCIVNTLGQVTVSPVQVAVTINKENQTTRTILESGKFSATVLAESASMELIGRCGFQCSREVRGLCLGAGYKRRALCDRAVCGALRLHRSERGGPRHTHPVRGARG